MIFSTPASEAKNFCIRKQGAVLMGRGMVPQSVLPNFTAGFMEGEKEKRRRKDRVRKKKV